MSESGRSEPHLGTYHTGKLLTQSQQEVPNAECGDLWGSGRLSGPLSINVTRFTLLPLMLLDFLLSQRIA